MRVNRFLFLFVPLQLKGNIFAMLLLMFFFFFKSNTNVKKKKIKNIYFFLNDIVVWIPDIIHRILRRPSCLSLFYTLLLYCFEYTSWWSWLCRLLWIIKLLSMLNECNIWRGQRISAGCVLIKQAILRCQKKQKTKSRHWVKNIQKDLIQMYISYFY